MTYVLNHLFVFWPLLGLFMAVCINVFAYRFQCYTEYSNWKFRGITPRLIIVDTLMMIFLPVTIIVFLIGLVWALINVLTSDWAGKPLCNCLRKKVKRDLWVYNEQTKREEHKEVWEYE